MVSVMKSYLSGEVLKKWKESSTKLDICSVKKIFYSDVHKFDEGLDIDSNCFALEIMDGKERGYLDVIVDKKCRIGENVLKANDMCEFFKTLMYVNELELIDLMNLYIKGMKFKFELYFEI